MQLGSNELADFGSFIGGVFSAISAALMFFTLRAEIRANNENKRSSEELRKQDSQRANAARVDSTHKWLEKQMDGFNYLDSTGFYALTSFLRQNSKLNPPKDSGYFSLYENPKMRELEFILELVDKLLEEAITLDLSREDEHHYSRVIELIIVKCLIESFYATNQSGISCPLCNLKYHGAIPCDLYVRILNLYSRMEGSKFSTVGSRLKYSLVVSALK